MPKFQKGNPGGPGRPSLTTEQREAKKVAKQLAGEAMDTLAKWMRSDNAKASVQASVAIINRAEGMPHQSLTTTVRDVSKLSDAELYAIVREGEGGFGDAAAEEDKGLPH